MKKFVSAAMAIIGIIAVVTMVYFVVHYGEVNTRRCNEAYAHWRFTGEFR